MKWLVLATRRLQASFRPRNISFHTNPRVISHLFGPTRSLSLLSTTTTSQGATDTNRKASIAKVEGEIEEVKQAIKGVQILIASVGQEIKATEKELLGGKLSPSIKSILTKKFDGLMVEKKSLMDKEKTLMDKEKTLMDEKKALMDEKKSLMDEKKTLMDEKKALMDKEKTLMDKTKSSILHPFEFSIRRKQNFPKSGGGTAIFKREWLFNDITDMVLQKDDEDLYESFYWRAPAGSGKTVFLKLIGKKLQERGCVVYYMNTSCNLDKFEPEYYYELCRDAGDKTVVLMVDEVQSNIKTGIWTAILREDRPDNLLVLGVGIPDLVFVSPQFSRKFPEDGKLFPMFLTERDLPELVAYFCKESAQPKEAVANLCEQILVFTNGHFFPFVKFMEHLLSIQFESDASMHLSSQEFRNSSCYKMVKARCSFTPYMLDAATKVLMNQDNSVDLNTLQKLGIYYEDALISPFVFNEAFVNMKFPPKKDSKMVLLDESKDRMACAEEIICAGLHYISAEDFRDINSKYRAVENAIAVKWGYNVRESFSNVMMYFQARTMYGERIGPGARPLIDFVFNGRLHLGVEVAVNLNAAGIKEHLQRFDDKYIMLKDFGVVLHIDTTRSEPVLVESFDNETNNRIYTFLTSRNELYRGAALVKTQVSVHLGAPFEMPKSNLSGNK